MNFQELGKLPFEAMLPIAERLSPVSRVELADRLHLPPQIVNRCFNSISEDKHYFITVSRVPECAVHMKTPMLIDWIVARYHYLKSQMVPQKTEAMDATKSFRALAALMREVGEAATVIDQAADDGEFDIREIQKIKKEISDIIAVCYQISNGLCTSQEDLEC